MVLYVPSRSRYGIRSDPLPDRTAHFSARRSMWIRHDCLTGSTRTRRTRRLWTGCRACRERRLGRRGPAADNDEPMQPLHKAQHRSVDGVFGDDSEHERAGIANPHVLTRGQFIPDIRCRNPSANVWARILPLSNMCAQSCLYQ